MNFKLIHFHNETVFRLNIFSVLRPTYWTVIIPRIVEAVYTKLVSANFASEGKAADIKTDRAFKMSRTFAARSGSNNPGDVERCA